MCKATFSMQTPSVLWHSIKHFNLYFISLFSTNKVPEGKGFLICSFYLYTIFSRNITASGKEVSGWEQNALRKSIMWVQTFHFREIQTWHLKVYRREWLQITSHHQAGCQDGSVNNSFITSDVSTNVFWKNNNYKFFKRLIKGYFLVNILKAFGDWDTGHIYW